MADGAADQWRADRSHLLLRAYFLDHATVLVDPALQYGWIATVQTMKHLILGYVFRRADYPWVQNWGDCPSTGKFSRGLEFSTQPYDAPRQDAVAKNGMFGAPTFRWLPAKSAIHTCFLMFYAHTPSDFGKWKECGWRTQRFRSRMPAGARSLCARHCRSVISPNASIPNAARPSRRAGGDGFTSGWRVFQEHSGARKIGGALVTFIECLA